MTQGPQLEDRLRVALRRPEGAGWPDEHGAFDRFLRRRARRGRALAARAGLAWSSPWPWPPSCPGCSLAARPVR
jgi:hypothetical protein